SREGAPMSIHIGSWEFQGPFTKTMDLLHEPGIYAILSGMEDQIELLEIDETESIRASIEHHPWYQLPRYGSGGPLAVAVYYCPPLMVVLGEAPGEQLGGVSLAPRYNPT